MKIKFFLLGTEKHNSVKRFRTELRYVFSDYLSDSSDIQSFEDIKAATSSITKAISDTHAVVFIADVEQFGETKQMLSRAFGFDLGCDSDILQKACQTLGKDSEEEDYGFSVTHAFVPSQARVFVLDDGLYAGFSVANGNQTIIVLPYSKSRTSYILTSKIIPYLNASYHISIDAGKLKKVHTGLLVKMLRKKKVDIAVAGTNTASFFKDYISSEEGLKERIKISDLTEKRGDMQPVDYTVNLSVAASEFLSCPYGVAMSNAFYTGDSPDSEKIVYIAVTNERETSVRELRSFPGEDISLFLARCSGDLCMFITDILSNDDEHRADMKKRESAAIRRYKIAIISASAVLLAAVIFCVSYFYTHNYSFSQWGENAIEWVFPAGNPFAGMFSQDSDAQMGAEAQDAQEDAEQITEAESLTEGTVG